MGLCLGIPEVFWGTGAFLGLASSAKIMLFTLPALASLLFSFFLGEGWIFATFLFFKFKDAPRVLAAAYFPVVFQVSFLLEEELDDFVQLAQQCQSHLEVQASSLREFFLLI